jgi:hypothetical protein
LILYTSDNLNHLIEKGVNALYEDGAIYITNNQTDEMDMIDDIVHELAHSVENNFPDVIYGDGKLEAEFLRKKTCFQLSRVLKNEILIRHHNS